MFIVINSQTIATTPKQAAEYLMLCINQCFDYRQFTKKLRR